jgi:ankyrin repeat protein
MLLIPNLEIVEYLLLKEARTDERNRGGDTALALACLKNQKGN